MSGPSRRYWVWRGIFAASPWRVVWWEAGVLRACPGHFGTAAEAQAEADRRHQEACDAAS
jgi:hypothetical protein